MEHRIVSAPSTSQERAATLDDLCRRLGIDLGMQTDVALLSDVLAEDFYLDDFVLFRDLLGDKLTAPTPLGPMLEAIRTALIERHPAICEFAAELLRRDQLPALDGALARRVTRAIHHTFLLEELTKAMGASVEFLQQFDGHYAEKKRQIGIRTNRALAAIDIYRITGMLFSPAKLASVDFALRYGLDASEDLVISPRELRVGQATLAINILEAVLQDRAAGYRDNSIAGSLLAVNPYQEQRVRAADRFIESRLSQPWVSLYITWNMAFVLGNIRNVHLLLPKLFVPQVLAAPPAEFLTNRIHSLHATTHLALFARKKFPAGYFIPGREALARQWGAINLRHARLLFGDLYGGELTRTRDILRAALGA